MTAAAVEPTRAPVALNNATGKRRTRSTDEVGVLTAVEAARRALFFVELMRLDETRKEASLAYPKAARLAVQGHAYIVGSVQQVGEGLEFSHDEMHCRAQIHRIVDMVPVAGIEDDDRAAEWSNLQALCRLETDGASVSVPLPTVDVLDATLTGFLGDARSRFLRAYEDVLSQTWRHFATLTTLFISWAIFFAVPQIRSLLLEQWQYACVGLLVVIPAPIFWAIGFLMRRRKNGEELSFVAKLAHSGFFWRWQTRYPKGYDVFAPGNRIGTQIAIAAAIRTPLFLSWVLVCALGLRWFDSVRILQTIGWTVCVLAVALTFASLLDLWDFVHPAPIRGLFLILTLGLWAFYACWDLSSSFLALILTVGLLAGLMLLYLARATAVVTRRWVSIVVVACVAWGLGAISAYVDDSTEAKTAWASPSSSDTPYFHPLGYGDWPHPGTALPNGNLPPVVVMAASGGGSRAAVLTALTLERLDTTRTCDGRPMSDHLQAISSVSGGSLATAAYVGNRLVGKTNQGLDVKMADDFLQPVLLGALWPSVSRGTSLENYWAKQLGLGSRLSAVAARWKRGLKEEYPPLPMPLFNSATLDAFAVVISPLSFHQYMMKSEQLAPDPRTNLYSDEERPTWIYYRSSVYSLEDLVPGFDPNLASAVRASANFPFGFPVVQVATDRPLPFSPRKEDRAEGSKERVRLTDGGVVSNSGMWTLFRLLKTKSDELVKRGVVLIIVDASKMPEYGGRTRTRDLLGSIYDRAPFGGNLHAAMIELLRLALKDRLAVEEIAVPPDAEHNVYTSWALDQRSLAAIKGEEKPTAQGKKSMRDILDASVSAAAQHWCDLRDPKATIAVVPQRLPLD